MSQISKLLVCLTVLLVLGDSQAVMAQWVKAPSKEVLESTPGLVHETFESGLMKTTVGYSVILPPGYNTCKERYPVVYWLHGGGGNECSSLFTAKSWSDLYAKGEVGKVILVYPNGFRSGYMDHHDGKTMIESMIIRELIPRIDQRYRTIATREGRAAHGFSMGASGSLKFAIKYPKLFCAAVAYGGGAVDLEKSKSRFILGILERNLRSDPELIRQNNTYHYLEQNHAVLRESGLKVMLICGERDTWKESAETFHAAIQKKELSCQLKLVPDVSHNLRGLTEAEGKTAALFQDRVFRETLQKPSAAQGETVLTKNESYESVAEGRRQGFQVVLPPGYRPEETYPLFVQVFGGANLLPTRERPFIRARPSGRGVWGYRSMSRYDVMQVIARMKEAYSVDDNRVYITGTSAGATGVMHTAAQRPDVFAGVVPLVAFGNDLPLENFRNLPLRCEHGVNDWTSSIGNVRVQFQKLEKLGYDAVLNEHPTAGHGVRVPPPATMDWLFQQKRNPSPEHIVYSCEHPRDGRAYWLRIERFTDPHRIARIDARVDTGGIVVNTENIQQLSFDRATTPLKTGQSITIDGDRLQASVSDSQKKLIFARNEKWQQSTGNTDATTRRVYGAGGAAGLFQGEPLLVIYGTGADDPENLFLQQAAKILARSGGPTFRAASVQFPVHKDTSVNELPLENYNLLVVGNPQNNSVLAEIAPQLPYKIENAVMTAGKRAPLKLAGSVLAFHYFNPEHPKRAIYVVSPYLNENERQQFLKNPRLFLAGSDGFKMIDQPDLFVRGANLQIRREMQLNDDWQFININGADNHIPARFADRSHLAITHMKVMQRSANVDFALWWGPEDKGIFGGYDFNWLAAFDSDSYTQADYNVRRRATETMTATVPGSELLDIYNRWIAHKELVTWPTVNKENIDPEREYRIVIPMDLVPKLGQRRKILNRVAPGPQVWPGDVASEIFESVR